MEKRGIKPTQIEVGYFPLLYASDATAVLGDDPAIAKIVDAIAANATARGWRAQRSTIPVSAAPRVGPRDVV